MKRAKTISAFAILLTALWRIYTTIQDLSFNNPHSLDVYLSAKCLPFLKNEIVKYIPTQPETVYLERYKTVQEMILCRLAKRSREEDNGRPQANGTTNTLCPDANLDSLRVDTLCPLIRRKKILFAGPDTTFYLHANLLQAFELHENRSHSCLGTEFCTFHQICRVPRSSNSAEPFFPPGGFKKYPSNRELDASQSGILKYILSNSLYVGSDMQDPRYTDPLAQVDQDTGVRQKERYWLGQARKADVLVLNRGPLPAPAWTYDGTLQGNWSFVQKPLRIMRGREIERDGRVGENTLESRNLYGEGILDIALRVTVAKFLPEIVETLKALSKEAQQHRQVVLWHGSWIMEPECAGKDARGLSTLDSKMDSWTLFYNAQGKMIVYHGRE
ncbi:uncharacterized protein C8R40DRAFT_116886 [Lentinula edodes]|uniref:uncharacterized protein n=1 Tax=Lentinula edodes TaxID=5353 RepID=UPI001E8E67D6|nr:uncharacterized protein C8R40DRAFT_116886 [Lentinula edodes]KAH7876783.1 hypothetical protein C8R40DRAFT_116886 [Lentinula edodes]